MRTLQRILLPVDFSERSAGAARYAKSLAVHFQSELILYHVLTPPQLSLSMSKFGKPLCLAHQKDAVPAGAGGGARRTGGRASGGDTLL